MVRTEGLAAGLAGDRKIGEVVHVPGGLEHRLRTDGVPVDLHETLLQPVYPAPQIGYVALERGSQGTVVIKSGDAAVYLVRGVNEAPSLA